MRARHRLGKMLLRHDIRFEETTSRSGERHRSWLAKLDLPQPGAQATLSDYVGAIYALVLRRDTLEATIAELVPGSPVAQTVARLRCLGGSTRSVRSASRSRSATSLGSSAPRS